MRRSRAVGGFLIVGLLGAPALAQSGGDQPDRGKAEPTRVERLEQRLKSVEAELSQLRSRADNPPAGVGSAGRRVPAKVGSTFAELMRGLPFGQDTATSGAAERIRIGGRLDFEFYDLRANRNNLGNYRGNQFGLNSGATEFRVRRVNLNLDLEMIEDFVFHSTLTLDPVVRDEDEGAVDIDEAYVRFGNVMRNLFGVEDPSNSYIQVGNFYRWERSFFPRVSEAYSLAGTSFYRDEVTGIQIGGDFEEGLFYRVGLDNGSSMTARDAGVGARRGAAGPGAAAVGNSPILHDNEQLGDLNNSKDFSIGVGYKGRIEDPNGDIQFGAAISYREGRLSNVERTFLSGVSAAYDGGKQKRRIGLLGMADWDLDTLVVGLNLEAWFASDGNGDRDVWSIGPWVKLPLDGVYYQKRKFFTGVGAGYRVSSLHQSDGFASLTAPTGALFDDRTMHTIDFWLDVTRNVDLRLEINNMNPINRNRSETEWLIQWSVRF